MGGSQMIIFDDKEGEEVKQMIIEKNVTISKVP